MLCSGAADELQPPLFLSEAETWILARAVSYKSSDHAQAVPAAPRTTTGTTFRTDQTQAATGAQLADEREIQLLLDSAQA